MENIDCIYYINLEHRTDRKQQFLEEMKLFDIPESKLHRIEANYTKEFGAIGCAFSHIHTLQKFIESPHNTCIIFEDDWQFTLDKEHFYGIFTEIFKQKVDYDIILLGGKIIEEKYCEYHFLRRILEAQTTSAYMVTKSFAKILKKNFEEGVYLLQEYFVNHNTKVNNFWIDQHWKALQKNYKWYILFPKAGIQRESYSDIEEQVTNYGV